MSNSNETVISISQIGYKPASVKNVTLISFGSAYTLPDKFPFFIQRFGNRLKRKHESPEGWEGNFFSWPMGLGRGEIDESEINENSSSEKPVYKGWLKKKHSRWGAVWQADFSDFSEEGVFQIETQYQASTPFAIDEHVYERLIRSYLIFINAQRSGFNNPGIRSARHLDDGKLDHNGQQINAAGGWYDAGDYRKWMTLTQGNLNALCKVARCGIPEFEEKALEEIQWGNRFFHAMINEEGQVYEDIGGGDFKKGLSIERDWWYENHPGCNCNNAGNYHTDNLPESGDERIVRTSYNPLVHFQFVEFQAHASRVLDGEKAEKCNKLARRAWEYVIKRGHDNRTLFLSSQISAAIQLFRIAPDLVGTDKIEGWLKQLLERQYKGDSNQISGFYMEDGQIDGYRSIAFSTYPAMAILNAYKFFQDEEIKASLKSSLKSYINDYLIADSLSNPFELVPYGVFTNAENGECQRYRSAGGTNYIRTFMPPISKQQIIHGTSSVITAHAGFLAEAAGIFNNSEWHTLAEKQMQWSLGHNTQGLSLFGGIGYKHPVAYSTVHVQIPEAPVVGFIGTPDDSPYMETSNWVEWSTQEMWDVPFYGAIDFALNQNN